MIWRSVVRPRLVSKGVRRGRRICVSSTRAMRTGSQPPPDFGRLALTFDPRLDAGDRAAGQLLTDALLDVADHHQVLPRSDRRDDSLAVGAGGASGAVHVVIDALR